MRRRTIGAQMMILCLLLAACGGGEAGANRSEQLALDIRTEYIGLSACTASMELTADYGERVYTYGMDLNWQKDGETLLTLTAPASVAGATVRIASGQTALEFDGARIETGPLNAAGLSPVDAVPALLAYAREGFMAECGEEELDGAKTLHVIYREADATPGTGAEAALWFDADTHALLRGELLSDGFAVIQCVFTSFQMT